MFKKNIRPSSLKTRLTALAVSLGWLFFCASGFCHKIEAQYRFDSWTTEQGLPQNSVNAVRQTGDGYLWLATFDGLVRFDGMRFTIFDKANSKGIKSNRFTCLFEDAAGTLWAGTEDGGVTRYENGVFTTYTTENGLAHNQIRFLLEDAAGNLLVATRSRLMQRRGEEFIPRQLPTEVVADGGGSRNPALDGSFYYAARDGSLWYHEYNGFFRLKEGQLTRFTLPSYDVAMITEDRAGDIWIGTAKNGLYLFRDGELKRFGLEDGLPDLSVRVIYEDRAGNVWLGTQKGLCRYADGKFVAYTTADGLSGDDIRSLAEDAEGNIWAGTFNQGLNRVSRRFITVYSSRNGLSGGNVYPILEDRAGSVWIGTWDGGLSRYENGNFTHFGEREGFPFRSVSALWEDRQGCLWAASSDNLFCYKDGKFTDFTEAVNVRRGFIGAIYEDRNGVLWLGTKEGLMRYQNSAATAFTTAEGLAGNDVQMILEDGAGALWLATYGGLSRFSDNKFTTFTERDGLSSNRLRTVYEDAEGTLWIGTYDGGLNRFKDGKFTRYTTADGLFNNGVFRILADENDNFWISSNRGIYRVSRQELNDFADGKISRVNSVAYGKQEGLLNSECNGGQQPAGIKSKDGRLWFPTQNGVAVIDPKLTPVNSLPPPIVIENCLVDRQTVNCKSNLELAPDRENLEIEYTGLSFVRSEQVRFKYKLEGLDDDWVEAGTRRAAYFSHLPPGEYVFKVMAANSDGVWNENAAQILIRVLPPFWRTWWFFALAALSLAALVFLLYERRVSNFRRAGEAQSAFSRRLIESQEQERKRIAAELHDGLGQNLLVIKNRALLGLMQPEEAENALEQLAEISGTASQTIEEVRSIAHNLRPYQLDRLGLTLALEAIVKKVSQSSTIRFSSEIHSIDDLFSPETEINFYRIVQECLNNIVKHSDATEAIVRVERDAQSVKLFIADNGKGFDLSANKNGKGGLGLTSIAERAQIINARYSFHSAVNEGTTFSLTIDLPDEKK